MKNIVGIDANHDSVTLTATKYRTTNVYPYLKAQGCTVTRFIGKRTSRAAIVPAARNGAVVYLTGVGHGAQDCYMGNGDAVLFKSGGYDPEEVSNKIVHFLSCLTALQLGPDLVTNGARAFFGYDDYFTFDPDNPEVFLECDSEIDRAFADGLTAAEVYERTVAVFNARINEANAQGKHYLAARLDFSLSHLCAPSVHQRFGAEDATL